MTHYAAHIIFTHGQTWDDSVCHSHWEYLGILVNRYIAELQSQNLVAIVIVEKGGEIVTTDFSDPLVSLKFPAIIP